MNTHLGTAVYMAPGGRGMFRGCTCLRACRPPARLPQRPNLVLQLKPPSILLLCVPVIQS